MSQAAPKTQPGSVAQQVTAAQQRVIARRLAVVHQARRLRTSARLRITQSLPSRRWLWLAAATTGASVGVWIYRRRSPKPTAPPPRRYSLATLTTALSLAHSLLTFMNLRSREPKKESFKPLAPVE